MEKARTAHESAMEKVCAERKQLDEVSEVVAASFDAWPVPEVRHDKIRARLNGCVLDPHGDTEPDGAEYLTTRD